MTTGNDMKMTPEETLAYLDGCIRHWRRVRDKEESSGTVEAKMAMCYVDAFQSVRSSVFGALLPVAES